MTETTTPQSLYEIISQSNFTENAVICDMYTSDSYLHPEKGIEAFETFFIIDVTSKNDTETFSLTFWNELRDNSNIKYSPFGMELATDFESDESMVLKQFLNNEVDYKRLIDELTEIAEKESQKWLSSLIDETN